AAIAGMSSESDKATTSFLRQKESVQENEAALKPLISRYEELKGKNRLSNDEHIEFKGLIEDIGGLMPGVVTEYSKYGTAVDINIEKVRELTKAQRELLQLREKDTIASLESAVRENLKKSSGYSQTANALL